MHLRLFRRKKTLKMAATGSTINSDSHAKPKSRTAVNGRFAFEDLREITPETLEFGIGAPSFAMMAKLKPLLAEATKQRMVRYICTLLVIYC